MTIINIIKREKKIGVANKQTKKKNTILHFQFKASFIFLTAPSFFSLPP